VFHIGFGNHQRLRRELDLDNAAINSMLNSLQNEGMATYVACQAQPIFPASEDRDYEMLERHEDVERLLKNLDNLFRGASGRIAKGPMNPPNRFPNDAPRELALW
jgi:hypothetical protein